MVTSAQACNGNCTKFSLFYVNNAIQLHSCCAKVLLLSQKESNYILHYFSIFGTLWLSLRKICYTLLLKNGSFLQESIMIYTFFYDNLQVYKCIQSTIKCCQRFNLWSYTLKNEIFVIVLELQTASNLAGPFLNFIEPGFVHEKPNFELALPEMKKSKQTTHHPNPPKIQNF